MSNASIKTEKQIEEEHAEQLLKLKDLRNRANKRNLTTEERIDVLQQIYDGSLISVQSAILMGEYKGTAALSTVMERIRMELSQVKETTTHAGKDEEHNHTMKYEYELPEENGDS
jgi:hypothetical protein